MLPSVSVHESRRATQVTLKAVVLLASVVFVVFAISFIFSDRGLPELQHSRTRVADLLLAFFRTDATAKLWYLKPSLLGAPGPETFSATLDARPRPAGDLVRFRFAPPAGTSWTLTVYDVTGRAVWRDSGEGGRGDSVLRTWRPRSSRTAPGVYLESPENRDCLAASRRLLAAAPGRAVFAGTCFEYDTRLGLLSEESAVRPTTLYARSKDELRREVEARPDSAWLRFFYLYGPMEDPRRFVPALIRSLLKGEEAKLSPGGQRRSNSASAR